MGGRSSKHNETEAAPTHWEPYSFFDSDADTTWAESGRRPFALLILNQDITDSPRLRALWKNAHIKVCADGGANRLHDHLSAAERELFLPTAICGDFDSLRPSVRTFYESRGVRVIHDASQDTTDFGKSMEFIAKHDPESSYIGEQEVLHPKMTAVAIGGIGGRVDQSFHSIHALYTTQDEGRRLIITSSENITFLLAPGRNVIDTPREKLGPTCGILPVGQTAVVTTDGFVWDMKDQETRFGRLVSTSNALAADTVTVETTWPVVFTVELKK